MIKTKNSKLVKILLFFIILLVMKGSFVNSVSFPTDFSDEMGLEKGTVIGLGVEFEKQTTRVGNDKWDSYYFLHFIGDNAIVKIEGNTFKNIIKQLKAFHPSFIKLNDVGKIVLSDFTVDSNGGNYTFGNKVIMAPPNSRIFFDINKGVEIRLPEGTDFENFPNLLESLSEGLIIEGKDITLPNDIHLIDGELIVEEKGFFLEEGIVEYKQMRINSNDVLIANSDADLSDYDKSWIRQTSSTLEIQSVEEKIVQLEFLEDHEILNTDIKDKLSISIEDGDGLKFEKRLDEGLVPKVVHESSENGRTEIFNDKLEFTFEENEFFVAPPLGLEDEDFSEKYQSVAFEIESTSSYIDEKIRVNSYRQFSILSENNEEIINYNEYGLPISIKIEDNELQSLKQLREKYPELDFEITEDSQFPDNFEESDFPPYLIYYTDTFLESNPNALEDLNKITYGNYLGASSKQGGEIFIGRLTVDPSEPKYHSIKIREITNPLYIFQHEYEHRLDTIVRAKEWSIIEDLNDPEIREFFYEKWYEDIPTIEAISKSYYDNYPDGMLRQRYNEIAIEAIEKLNENSELMDSQLRNYLGDDEYVSLLTGIPYDYSLRNYNEFSDASLARYSELSSTYREQPIETIKMRIQSASPIVSEMYTKLTQLAFDSGKMDVEKYQEIMGNDYCEDLNCLDKLCVEYKLLCCKEHPSSPNC